MKAQYPSFIFAVLFVFVFQVSTFAQIIISPGPAVTPTDMVDFLMGPGVTYDNLAFQGADNSSGIFTEANTTNLGLLEGVFLTSGDGMNIPGPNNSGSSGSANGTTGHYLLELLTTSTSYDAAVLEFDFTPMNDTIKCRYVFGSEEYNEWVNSSFNDVFGFFVSGPNPAGGDYEDENVAIVPETTDTYVAINNLNNGWASTGVSPTGPCENCEYFIDNTGGLSIEYDGFTKVLTASVLVTPGEVYHFAFAVSDVGDGIFDTGVFIEGTSFKSPGPADFFAFDFLTQNNPELTYDVIGTIEGQDVFLELPEGTDVSSLVATYEEHGADVFVNGIRQENGVTPNDFTEEVIYELEGYEKSDWVVHVDFITDIPKYVFQSVKMGPNPSEGNIRIENIAGMKTTVFNTLGHVVVKSDVQSGTLEISDLIPGIYFVRLEKDDLVDTRKIVVR